jgi:hypothetical protein
MRPRPRTSLLPVFGFLALTAGLALAACDDRPHSPLVGTWRDARWTDTVDVFRRQYTFADDGTLTIRMRRPPASDTTFSATYTLTHDSLLTLADARGSEQFIARVRGDTLVLRTPEMTTTLLRVAE